MKRIKKNDTVIIITGSDKGHVGKVMQVSGDKVKVEGARMLTKHLKANPQIEQKAAIVKRESFLHISNVAIYNPQTKKADKIKFEIVDNAEGRFKKRYFKSTNNEIVSGG